MWGVPGGPGASPATSLMVWGPLPVPLWEPRSRRPGWEQRASAAECRAVHCGYHMPGGEQGGEPGRPTRAPRQLRGHHVAVKKEGGGQSHNWWLGLWPGFVIRAPRLGSLSPTSALEPGTLSWRPLLMKQKLIGQHQGFPRLSPSQALEAETGRLAMFSWPAGQQRPPQAEA